MGRLRNVRTDKLVDIPADALAGRHNSFDILLTDERASAPHARLRWHDDRWQLQDLASRNGTFVNGKPLEPGERKALKEKMLVQFGTAAEEFRLDDDSPPKPLARHIKSGRTVAMQGDLLTLPNADAALACLYPSPTVYGELSIEIGSRFSEAVDREVIQLEGELWQLRTTLISHGNTQSLQDAGVDDLHLTIVANHNMEDIALILRHGNRRAHIDHHAWHELLLVLARQRHYDTQRGVAAKECGWLHRDELCTRLNLPVAQLNVAIHRTREQFRNFGVLPSAAVIERRRGSGEIRLGVTHIVLQGAAAS